MPSPDACLRTAIARAPSHFLICLLLVTGSTLPIASVVAGVVDVCSEPSAGTWMSLEYFDQQTALLKGGNGTTNREDYGADLLVDLQNGWRIGAGYRGTSLRVSGLPLQTNGYLHTLYLPVHRVGKIGSGSYRIGVAAAVATSSNVFSDPGRYTTEDVQLPVAFVWSRRTAPENVLRIGVCADRRFGNRRVYPVLLTEWELGVDWQLALGYPVSALTYRARERIRLRLGVGPAGHAWRVQNRNFTRQSRLTYEAQRLDVSVEWRGQSGIRIAAILGIDLNGRYDLPLSDGRRGRFSTDSPAHFGVRVARQF